MTLVSMFFIGLSSWLIATVTAGGAGLIFLVVAGFVLPLPAATIILGFAGTVAGFYRAWIYRKDVNWSILKWLIPGTLLGSAAGALLFSSLVEGNGTNALKIFLAILLLFSGFFGFFKIKVFNFPAKTFLFFPMGIFTSFLSGLIGAASPIINTLFQKFSLRPNQVIGTKSLNIFILQLSKTFIYIGTVVLSGEITVKNNVLTLNEFLLIGCVTAIGSSIGVHAGKHILGRMDEEIFNKLLNVMMFAYGLYLIAMGMQ